MQKQMLKKIHKNLKKKRSKLINIPHEQLVSVFNLFASEMIINDTRILLHTPDEAGATRGERGKTEKQRISIV